MHHREEKPLVSTIKEHCRVCYTCVRECPAKAIRIEEGQAEVIEDRCIGCGNCVRVCSQNAKVVLSSVEETRDLLQGSGQTAALVAPSFAAEFAEEGAGAFVGGLKALGFDYVLEVSFGADLVCRRYVDLMENNSEGKRYIATTCPALIGYVERYHPELVDNLAPIVSPMIAAARAGREVYGQDVKMVFIGPCIAKKGEAASDSVWEEVDSVLTFQELRRLFVAEKVELDGVEEGEFDPPHAGRGALFPISRGMLQASGLLEDLLAGQIIAADGNTNFVSAIKEFESGAMEAQLLELLCCNGCIMGAGMSVDTPSFRRRAQVSRHARDQVAKLNWDDWETNMDRFKNLDLSRGFVANDKRSMAPSEAEIREILVRMGKFEPEDELNCGACGYQTCVEHAMAIFKGRAESEMCLPYTIEELKNTVSKLASTQEALVNSEKLASMGQLAAGVAHEVNNPLGVVLMYAHLMMEELKEGTDERDDLEMIVSHADRCKKIIAGLLNFARQSKVERRQTDVRQMVNHIVKTLKPPANIQVQVNHQLEDPMAEMDEDQIVQVLTNLANNALHAMEDQEKGTLTLETEGDEQFIRIYVEDTGTGISEENRKKIFEPFFTTKETGKGTGLGLAVTYGIMKMHHGDIQVQSNDDPEKGPTGTRFKLLLPRIKPEGEESGEAEAAKAELEKLVDTKNLPLGEGV